MNRKHSRLLASAGFAAFLCGSSPAWAQSLGTAASFAVLGGSTVTNTGPSVIAGDLGCQPRERGHGLSSGGRDRRNDPCSRRGRASGSKRRHHHVQFSCGPSLYDRLDRPGSRWIDAHARCLLLCIVGSVDWSTHSQRRRDVHFSDRNHAHDRKRLVRRLDPWRLGVQCVVAGRQLRNSRYSHVLTRKYSRAHEHNPEYRRERFRESPGAKRRSDAGWKHRFHVRKPSRCGASTHALRMGDDHAHVPLGPGRLRSDAQALRKEARWRPLIP